MTHTNQSRPETDAASGRRLAAKSRPRVKPELFQPVVTRAASQDVARQILELVETGAIQEGDVLPGERVLADVMQVSRPTIRLAVAALAREGLLEVKPGRQGGIELKTRWIPDTLRTALLDVMPVPAEDLFEILEARRAIEPRVAQLAAMRGTIRQFDGMRQALQLQQEHLDDHPKAMQAELMFHRRMWEAAQNSRLEGMLSTLFDQMTTILDTALRTASDRNEAMRLNEQTVDVLARGDVEQVDAVMDQHLNHLERIVEDTFGHRRIRPVPAFLGSRRP